jgi:hypothetical protein
MDINNTYLKYKEEDGTPRLVCISAILETGDPMVPDSEERLELWDDNVYNEFGEVVT